MFNAPVIKKVDLRPSYACKSINLLAKHTIQKTNYPHTRPRAFKNPVNHVT